MLTVSAEWRPWGSLEALYLGEIIVGRVAQSGGGRCGTKPRAIFNLAAVETGAFWVKCTSIAAAKLHIENRLVEWLRRAGLE
jgi:hypothetical protein